jgi:hypothetical protein
MSATHESRTTGTDLGFVIHPVTEIAVEHLLDALRRFLLVYSAQYLASTTTEMSDGKLGEKGVEALSKARSYVFATCVWHEVMHEVHGGLENTRDGGLTLLSDICEVERQTRFWTEMFYLVLTTKLRSGELDLGFLSDPHNFVNDTLRGCDERSETTRVILETIEKDIMFVRKGLFIVLSNGPRSQRIRMR